MNDLISRADAIEAVCDKCDANKAEHYPNCKEIKYCAEVRALSALPSAEAEPSLKAIKRQIDEHWYLDPPSAETVSFEDAMQIRNTILFKEYMRGRRDAAQGWRTGKPTKGGKYIVTLIGIGDYRFVDIMHYDKPVMPNKEVDGTCWYMDDDEWGDVVYDDKDILAWMPLPKPYKGGGGE